MARKKKEKTPAVKYQDVRQEMRGGKRVSSNLRPAKQAPTTVVLVEEPEVSEPPVITQDSASLRIAITPNNIDELRKQKATAIAQGAVNELLNDMLEDITLTPDMAIYHISLSSYASDIRALIVISLGDAGWKIKYDGHSELKIELPPVGEIASYNTGIRSAIGPL